MTPVRQVNASWSITYRIAKSPRIPSHLRFHPALWRRGPRRLTFSYMKESGATKLELGGRTIAYRIALRPILGLVLASTAAACGDAKSPNLNGSNSATPEGAEASAVRAARAAQN